MGEKVVRLPDSDEMLRRLVAVMDEPHARQKFYPKLLRSAGEELYPEGVVNILMGAIYEYTLGFPPSFEATVYMRFDEYLGALIPDAEAAQEARDHYAKVCALMRDQS